MRSVKLSTVLVMLGLSLGTAFVSGCNSQMKDLENRNRIQQARITELESQLQAAQLQLDQLKRQLDAANATGGVEVDSLRQEIAALKEDIAKKEAMIKAMQDRLMGVSVLPVELNDALEEFARGSDLVEYDASRGLVKFKSDLLFEKGSDVVTSQAAEAVRKLAQILNSEQARQFHVIVAGHTDDMPIQRADTRAKHPTNRALSSHRAIAVVEVMEKSGIESVRLSTRGFGEYRPIEPNAAGKKGNPKNRRVEIYIVPEGA
ncbi:MAG TPA: OmpA family protein [Sedimentisphaerales bacterium]|jgi:chemotaxis protein MotB|nr:OmpA family protein [Sedimentisphaerales bacterium]HNU28985.1 OmpA family protein [Sedimentisphaerales bacterium]